MHTGHIGCLLLVYAAEPDSIAAVIAAICRSEAFGEDPNRRPDAAVGTRHQGDRSFDSLCVHCLFLFRYELVLVGHEIDLAPGIGTV